jgi:hypothetical protein
MSGTGKLAEVWAMLDQCAPGHTREERKRNFCVRFNGRTYPQLSLGAPGSKQPEIRLGNVRQMANQLGLDAACVNRHFPGLLKVKDQPEVPRAK